MSTENNYAKHYLNRRPNTENSVYCLVLFPSDNSIAVVKAKQCSPADHDGFVFVQSGKKKFTGVVFEEGSLSQCSEAADRLTKKTVNPEIESDYERNNDMNKLKQPATTTTPLTSLKTIPFTEKNFNGQPRLASTITVSTGNSANNVTVDQSINNSSLKENEDVLVEVPTATHTTIMSTSNNLSKPSNTHHKKKSILKNKRFKQANGESSSTILFQNKDNTLNDSDTSDDERSADNEHHTCTNQLSDQVPIFNGRLLTSSKKFNKRSSTTSSSEIQQLLSLTQKLETQYLKPMLVQQDRLETMMRNLFANQKKIQNILRKQKMNILLLDADANDEPVENESFESILEYTLPNGSTIDLLRTKGVKEHANLYVTSLMNTLFNDPEELISIEAKDLPNDNRYHLIKEAVRNKFRLSKDELETMWVWLHTVILAKRRTIDSKLKKTQQNQEMNN